MSPTPRFNPAASQLQTVSWSALVEQREVHDGKINTRILQRCLIFILASAVQIRSIYVLLNPPGRRAESLDKVLAAIML